MDALAGHEVKQKTGASDLQSDALGPKWGYLRGGPINEVCGGPSGIRTLDLRIKRKNVSELAASELHQEHMLRRVGSRTRRWVDRTFCTEVGVLLLEAIRHNARPWRAEPPQRTSREMSVRRRQNSGGVPPSRGARQLTPWQGDGSDLSGQTSAAPSVDWRLGRGVVGVDEDARGEAFMRDMDARAGRGVKFAVPVASREGSRDGTAAFHSGGSVFGVQVFVQI